MQYLSTEQVVGNVEDKMNKTQNYGRKFIHTSTDEGYQCWRLKKQKKEYLFDKKALNMAFCVCEISKFAYS